MNGISRSVRLKLFICAFFLGVGVGSVLPWWTVFAGFVPFLSRKRGGIAPVFGYFFGFLLIAMTFPTFGPDDVGFYRDMRGQVQIEAVVVSDPEVRNDAQYLLMEARNLEEFTVRGKLLIKVGRYPEYAYGDVLSLRGNLVKPAVFEKFSYADYLAKDGIFAVMYQPRVFVLEKSSSLLDAWAWIFGLKHAIRDAVEQLFGEPGAGIVLGLLLGMRASIPDVLMDDFQRSGLTHILAISGYNITLLITIVGTLLKSLGRRTRFVA